MKVQFNKDENIEISLDRVSTRIENRSQKSMIHYTMEIDTESITVTEGKLQEEMLHNQIPDNITDITIINDEEKEVIKYQSLNLCKTDLTVSRDFSDRRDRCTIVFNLNLN